MILTCYFLISIKTIYNLIFLLSFNDHLLIYFSFFSKITYSKYTNQ
jgi:hypothetical protein